MNKSLDFYHKKLKKEHFRTKNITFNNLERHGNSIADAFSEINLLFSYLLKIKRPELLKYTPYKVYVYNLKEKNQWSAGDYVAIEQQNGTLKLYLAFKKIKKRESFPIYPLVFVLFHEFRHKIQINNEYIRSVIDFPNFSNFKEYIKTLKGCSGDTFDHVFHEINPAEIDANIFACELMGIKYGGNAFNITEDTLKLL